MNIFCFYQPLISHTLPDPSCWSASSHQTQAICRHALWILLPPPHYPARSIRFSSECARDSASQLLRVHEAEKNEKRKMNFTMKKINLYKTPRKI